MPTLDDQSQYRKLSMELRSVAYGIRQRLPQAAESLHFHRVGESFFLDAYDIRGELLAVVRIDQVPHDSRRALERLSCEDWPNPDGVLCML